MHVDYDKIIGDQRRICRIERVPFFCGARILCDWVGKPLSAAEVGDLDEVLTTHSHGLLNTNAYIICDRVGGIAYNYVQKSRLEWATSGNYHNSNSGNKVAIFEFQRTPEMSAYRKHS